MKAIRIVGVGAADGRALDGVRMTLSHTFAVRCNHDKHVLDPAFAYHPERNQYHSTMLVEHLARKDGPEIIVGITDVDLFIPILTFVFGEAQVGMHTAVVSYHRLDQKFYGLPPDPDLLTERLIKETIHEVGHAVGLHHCDDYDCVMAPSHSVEWLDVKSAHFCAECRKLLV